MDEVGCVVAETRGDGAEKTPDDKPGWTRLPSVADARHNSHSPKLEPFFVPPPMRVPLLLSTCKYPAFFPRPHVPYLLATQTT